MTCNLIHRMNGGDYHLINIIPLLKECKETECIETFERAHWNLSKVSGENMESLLLLIEAIHITNINSFLIEAAIEVLELAMKNGFTIHTYLAKYNDPIQIFQPSHPDEQGLIISQQNIAYDKIQKQIEIVDNARTLHFLGICAAVHMRQPIGKYPKLCFGMQNSLPNLPQFYLAIFIFRCAELVLHETDEQKQQIETRISKVTSHLFTKKYNANLCKFFSVHQPLPLQIEDNFYTKKIVSQLKNTFSNLDETIDKTTHVKLLTPQDQHTYFSFIVPSNASMAIHGPFVVSELLKNIYSLVVELVCVAQV